MPAPPPKRLVLVHDWLTGMRGGEKVLEVFCRLWPQALLYTVLHKRGSTSEPIERLRPRTSFLQSFPAVYRYYRYLLPLMPHAVRWPLPDCDLVLSNSHCVAKGVQAPPGVPHVCYCLTPMRYAWHLRDAYFADNTWRGWKRPLLDRFLTWLRDWDRRTAQNVTHFVAISQAIRRRIQDCYGRDSTVIYPPVDTDYYTPAPIRREDFYLVTSAFAPYKRLDLAITACNLLRRRLVIIGTGQDEARLRALAGPSIHFLGWQPDAVIRDHLRRCRGLLFPGEEDFGIVPVEAMACGTPVIAYGRGGATETVVPLNRLVHSVGAAAGRSAEPTGLWFDEQTRDCLADGIELFERHEPSFNPSALRRHAVRFNRNRFETEITSYLERVVAPDRAAARRAA